MNDEQLISHIQTLKSQTPSQEVLSTLKSRILSDIEHAPVPSPIQPVISTWYAKYSVVLGGTVVALLILVQTGSAAFPVLPLKARIAAASNAYEKSMVAVDALEGAANAYHADPSEQNAKVLAQFIDTSRSQLDTLQLVGEVGKYTMSDCLSAYRSYYAVIDRVIDLTAGAVSGTPQTEAHGLLSQTVRSAEEEARERLGAYPPEVQVQLMD